MGALKARDQARVARRVIARVHSHRLVQAPLPAEVDVDALFDDTMKRFPETMARLAE